MARTTAPPPTDRGMWRKLLAKVHPDAGGDHETFVWVSALREHVAGDAVDPPRVVPRYAPDVGHRDPDRVPYDDQLGHIDEFIGLTHRALCIGKHAEEPHKSVLIRLIDCPATDHGRRTERQCRGASYRPLAAIAHSFGMTRAQRCRWYELARSVPLSDQHASHILGRLQREAA